MDKLTELALAEMERCADEMHARARDNEYPPTALRIAGWEAVMRMAIVRLYAEAS